MRLNLILFVTAAASLVPFTVAAQPLSGDPASGRQIAITQCSSCHRVQAMPFSDKSTLLANKDAPPSFQSIADHGIASSL